VEQSLIAAVSGIDANQTYLDVIGNNIANSNTTAYKSETVGFTDLLAEQIQGASAPSATSGGINPESIGAGVEVGTITEKQTQGAIQQTNVPSDVAIQGNGFLVASLAGQTMYTRDGQLSLDANGDLTAPNGALIQGWEANASGQINTNAPTTSITIPTSSTLPATATQNITLGGNLPSGSSSPVSFTTDAYDALGNVVPITFTLTPGSTANTWTLQATVPNGSGGTADLFSTSSPPTVTFGSNGQIQSVTGATGSATNGFTLPVTTMPPSPPYQFASGATLNIDFPPATANGAVTQFSGNPTLTATKQDGHAAGSLQSYSIGADGVITGSYSNGQSQTIAQIALATFANPSGLTDLGNLMYQATSNSGQAVVSTPGTGNAGTLVGGALEASNVDLSSQLTDLIVAQEAYQANTKVITTTDTAFQSLMQVP
jgi:flagellar hook protein FlgE